MNKRLQYSGLVAALAFGVIGATAQPAAAKTSVAATPHEVSPTACDTDKAFKPNSPNFWSFSVDFGDGSTDGCLMVTGVTAADLTSYPIACDVIGAVPVNNGQGYFDGRSYLACKIEWSRYIPGIKPVEIYTGGYQMKAALSKLAGSRSLTVGNPLIYHPSASIYAPRSIDGGMFPRHRFTSKIGTGTYVSDLPETAAGSAMTLRSLNNCSFAVINYNCKLRHHMNGGQVGQWTTNDVVKFDTMQPTFYVGYSPVQGADMLNGVLDYVIVDPQAGKGT